MLSLLDSALDRIALWVKQAIAPRIVSLKAFRVPIGLLLLTPLLLFPLLAVSEGLRWSDWGGPASRVLLSAMTLAATVCGLFYAAAATVLFLGLWRGKVTVPERKRARMKLNYLCSPFLYGLIAAWGGTALRGQPSGLLLHLNVAAWLLWWFANLVLTLAQLRKAVPGAV